MRAHIPLLMGLVMLLPFSGCERSGTRRARQAMDLIHAMGAELRTSAAQSSEAFTDRGDFEALRKAFGDDRFDAGIPLGPDFQKTLDTMLRDLEIQMEREPKDAEFLRKAARQVRLFSQWWTFIRQHLETRRSQLEQAPRNPEAVRLLGGRVHREDVLLVLAETIKVVGTFEAITARYVRQIEGLVALS